MFPASNLNMTAPIDNVIVVAHPDDEILGFGGTGAVLTERGESVQPIILCGSVTARSTRPSDQQLYSDIIAANKLLGFKKPILGCFPNLSMNTVPHLELVQFIESHFTAFNPRRVFTHHQRDLNDDHNCVARACLAAVRLGQRRQDINMVESVHCMEILSSTDWAFPYQAPPFEPNLFVGIEHTLKKKIEALSLYRNVMRNFPHPRSHEVLEGLAAYRGGQSGFRYAESFQTVFQNGI